jgi:hypothetical protein
MDFVLRLARRWELKTSKFVASKSSVVRNVRWIIRWQANGTNFVGETESSKMLHCARLRGIRLRIEGRARFLIDKNRGYATSTEFDRQHEPARPPTDDYYRTSQGEHCVTFFAANTFCLTGLLMNTLAAFHDDMHALPVTP